MFFLIHNLLLFTVKSSYRQKKKKRKMNKAASSLEPLRARAPGKVRSRAGQAWATAVLGVQPAYLFPPHLLARAPLMGSLEQALLPGKPTSWVPREAGAQSLFSTRCPGTDPS